MAQWHYHLTGSTPDQADEGRAGLVRVPVDGPVSLAEQLQRAGSWELTDLLWNIKYEGSDEATVEIVWSRAEQLIRTWFEIGRIEALPGTDSTVPPELAQRLIEADRQAAALWQRVEAPPGIENISF